MKPTGKSAQPGPSRLPRRSRVAERQAATVRTPPPLIQAVLDESCIRRPDLPVTIVTLPDRSLMSYAESAQRGHLERDNGGRCVEWAPSVVPTSGTVPVRDSKSPAGPVLSVPAAAFAGFVNGVTSGTFDS